MRSDSSARAVSMMIGIAAVCVVRPDQPADFETVDVRQHQIEHEQIRRLRGDRRSASRPDATRSVDEARFVEIARHEFGDVADRLRRPGCGSPLPSFYR